MARPLVRFILLSLVLSAAASAQFITPSPLPNGTIGFIYLTGFQMTTPHINWTIAKGALPNGLSIDSASGNISGTPTALGTFTFTVSAQDSSTFIVATKPYAITIEQPLAIASATTLPPVTVGGTYFFALQAVRGLPPYTWLAPVLLPPGMTVDSLGNITGVPTATGTFTFGVNVQDSSAPIPQQDTKQFTITVNPPPSGTGQLANGFIGQSYLQALPVTGGTGPFVFTLSGTKPPPGLSLSPDGTLSGTPTTEGPFRLAAVIRDAYGILGGGTYSLTILPTGVSILTQSLADGTIGQAYSQALVAVGGKPPYQWAKVAGVLPDGLTLDPTGAIAGTPTKLGAFGFTLQVTDSSDPSGSYSLSASRDFRITIGTGPPVIVTAALPDGTVSVPYSQTLNASGGVAPYGWSVDAGSLPSGLTLDPVSGKISGTPTATGTSTFTVRVSDAREDTSSKVLQLKVGAPPIPASDLPGIPDTLPPADQNDVQVHLADPYPLPIAGKINLEFTPGPPNGDDPAVQFSTGGRSVDFTIPAGERDAVFADSAVLVQTGTVAGTIKLTLQFLVDGVDLTPQPAPARTIQILPAVPVIRSVTATRTSTGISVEITGFSNTREVATATFNFPAPAGSHLTTTTLTIQATPLFTPYYGDEASIAFGSLFTYVQSFTIQGTASDVQEVGVVLTNSVGASAQVTDVIQ
ncbi:MAG: putative Ig domain-containing protein [Candidatus Solibacter usitatus]|nr:putative Ig domain-containing protein [Candidatus Solibacter usitatus]